MTHPEAHAARFGSGHSTAAAVEVQALGKTYRNAGGGVVAVDGDSFDLAEGEIFGLLGPNGAGKSSTVQMLATLLRPTAGTAYVLGHELV